MIAPPLTVTIREESYQPRDRKPKPSDLLPEARDQWRESIADQCAWVKSNLRLVGMFKLLHVQLHLELMYEGHDFVSIVININVPHKDRDGAVTIGNRCYCDRSRLSVEPLIDIVWKQLRSLLLHELGEGFEWQGKTLLCPHDNPEVES